MVNFDMRAFSSGQVQSKLWLCRELEELFVGEPLRIWLLGGWYGLAPFLMMSREKLQIETIRSFDLDEEAVEISKNLNKAFLARDFRFFAHVQDVSQLEYHADRLDTTTYGALPNLVINTSVEHFENTEWWDKIPGGFWVALQCTNLPHEQHSAPVENLAEMSRQFPLKRVDFSGELDIEGEKFKRFMLIGEK